MAGFEKCGAGAGRKPFDLDIEELLLEWVHDALMVFVYQGK